jgi:aldehyde dehydrogenase (NAD+)
MTSVLHRLNLLTDPRVVSTAAAPADMVAISHNPTTGEAIAKLKLDDADSYERIIATSQAALAKWQRVAAPVRGQIIREIGDAFRAHKHDLGELVSLEVGKIRTEGQGEIQEIIDIADFAVGLSRQLPGQIFPSERAGHKILEQWQPLGLVGVISAFNFPAAVWAWNAMLAAICGNVTIWKPSLLAPLTAIACNNLARNIASKHGHVDIFQLVIGSDVQIGQRLVADRRVPLISATGSCEMGRKVGAVVASRLGRCLLELGGNNAVIISQHADLNLAIPSVVFGAVGTAGQRCTTTRRLIVHESLKAQVVTKLKAAYTQVMGRIGDPLTDGTLIGPLINRRAVEQFNSAITAAKEQGGTVLVGGQVVKSANNNHGHFVEPTLIDSNLPPGQQLKVSMNETFAPILYISTFSTIEQAIAMNNAVDQGLSSALFTNHLLESEAFLSPHGTGSDCGIANINCGTSGAEIGGAFGGEKDTGGGRESGSDSWKAYMRRQTTVVNASGRLELAQGIRFE